MGWWYRGIVLALCVLYALRLLGVDYKSMSDANYWTFSILIHIICLIVTYDGGGKNRV